MVGCVILQFFTRYVLNDSFAWTEEIAIYALIVVVFLGASLCVRASRHIQVDFLYRYMSPGAGRVMATFVDVVRIGFFGYGDLADVQIRLADPRRDDDDDRVCRNRSSSTPSSLAFALMTLRALHVAWQNWRRGYSVLEKPEAFDGSEA